MKRSLLFLFAFVLLGFSTSALAQDAKQDFTLVNATGVEINEVHITPHDADEWGEDVLGRDVLQNDEECDIQFHPQEDVCSWDIRIADKEGNAIEWESIDLCKWTKITLKYDGQTATAEFE
jgi:hypothetical protein